MSEEIDSGSPEKPAVLTFDWGREFRRAREKGRHDGMGVPIPDEGPLRVFLGHETEYRKAPDGRVRVFTARDLFQEMLGARVVEISVDHDTDGFLEKKHGAGWDVVGFVLAMYIQWKILMWPRDGLIVYSKSAADREALQPELDELAEMGSGEITDSIDEPGRSHFKYQRIFD